MDDKDCLSKNKCYSKLNLNDLVLFIYHGLIERQKHELFLTLL